MKWPLSRRSRGTRHTLTALGGTGTQAGGPDLSAGLKWRISAGSPAIGAGVGVANNGGVDYAGVTVPAVPDIGALQHG